MALATSYTNFEDNRDLFDPLHRMEEETVFCERFERLSSFHLIFHVSCIILLTLQFSIFIGLLAYQPKSPYVAALLFSCILTLFSYLILLFYYQAKKPQDFLDLRRYFVQACRKEIETYRPNQDEHLFLAKAAESLTGKLGKTQFYLNKHGSIYSFIRLLRFKDIEKMQELLMYAAIQEHIEKIKKDPLDPQTHFSLAKSYLGMYRLYQSPLQESFSRFWIVKRIIQTDKRVKRVEASLLLAMEELKIGLSSNPEEPWALLELANCYAELNQKAQELEILKKLYTIATVDEELLLRIGKINFQLGLISEGLEIFSKLKVMNVHLSFELLDSYNAYLKKI
ncbi:MAG: tetratricopeptide repeat protein [Chlamydiia bacterium]